MNAANRCEETALHCFNEAAVVFVDINLLCCFVIDSCSVLAKSVCIEFFLKVYQVICPEHVSISSGCCY